MGGNPFEGGPGIFKGCGKRVLWGEPVLDGDGDDICLGGDEVEVAVVEEGEGGYEAESAAVKVDEDGNLFWAVRQGGFWEVESNGD